MGDTALRTPYSARSPQTWRGVIDWVRVANTRFPGPAAGRLVVASGSSCIPLAHSFLHYVMTTILPQHRYRPLHYIKKLVLALAMIVSCAHVALVFAPPGGEAPVDNRAKDRRDSQHRQKQQVAGGGNASPSGRSCALFRLKQGAVIFPSIADCLAKPTGASRGYGARRHRIDKLIVTTRTCFVHWFATRSLYFRLNLVYPGSNQKASFTSKKVVIISSPS